MSYKLVLIEKGGHECGNGCRFATRQEADDSHGELWRRWMLCPTDYRVDESDDPVNYKMDDGRLQSFGSLKGKS